MDNKTLYAWLLAVLALSSALNCAEAGISVTPEAQVMRLSTALEDTAIVTLKVSGAPADIDLEWSNYPGTSLTASRVSWRNFLGEEAVTIKVTRTPEETKSRDFVLRFESSTPDVSSASAIVSSSAVRHPYALFSDIKETPGYTYNLLGREPYASWHGQILEDTEEDGLSYDFCGSGVDDSWRVFELALSYQMTGEPAYADKALEGLECIPAAGYSGDRVEGSSLLLYSLSYDMIAEYLIDKDPRLYLPIRGTLAGMSRQCFDGIATHENAHDKILLSTGLGVSGVVLKDYEPVSGSGPGDWLNAASNRLWVSDSAYGRPYSLYYNSPEGFSELGAYKYYWIRDYVIWANVYDRSYGNFSSYAVPANILNEVLWILLPSGVMEKGVPSHNTRDNFLDLDLDYSYYVLDILPEPERGLHKWIVEDYLGENATARFPVQRGLQYILYDNSVRSHKPSALLRCPQNSEACIFRSGYTNTSSFLFLKAPHYPVPSDRVMIHHDSMSFDYYDMGDYLLIDSGEVKYREEGYGPISAKGHNTIMVSDGITGNPGGPVKGDDSYTDYSDPAYITSSLSAGFLDYGRAEIRVWDRIEETSPSGEYVDTVELSSPVSWARSVLYPSGEYFLLLDRVNGSTERKISSLLHLGSFGHSKTTPAVVGTVEGVLAIEGAAYPWETQGYNKEVDVKEGNSLSWSTTNINGDPIQLTIFSSPKSQISVQKYWARIGRDEPEDEVDHPLVRLKSTGSSLYRITALHTRYLNESGKAYSEVPVLGGEGRALKITGGDVEDTVSLGRGDLISADRMETDAPVAFARSVNRSLGYFFIDAGSRFSYDGVLLFNSSRAVSAALTYLPYRVHGNISGDGSYHVTVKTGMEPYSVRFNGRNVSYRYISGVLLVDLYGSGELDIWGRGTDLGIWPGDVFFLAMPGWVPMPPFPPVSGTLVLWILAHLT